MASPPTKSSATPKAMLNQLFVQKWKGNLDWSAKGGITGPGQSHFVAKVQCSDARVRRQGQEAISVPDMEFEGEARTKREAEHAAAQHALDWLKKEGYWDPEVPEPPKETKTRADKFRIEADRVDINNPLVFLELTTGGKPAGTLVIELYEHAVPQASENFRQLCTGEAVSKTTGKQLSYKGACFHRAIKRFMVEGGDITNGDGSGGESIYGRFFDDEPPGLALKHNKPFVVSLSNMGTEHTNSSAFFITTAPCTHINGEYVVCGQVVKGFGAVRQVEHTRTDPRTSRPLEPCIISNCGQLPSDFNLDTIQPLMEGAWPLWAEDLMPPPGEANEARFRLRVAQGIKESANEMFRAGDAPHALVRYDQAIQCLNWITLRVMHDLAYDDQLAMYNEEYLLRLNRAAALLRMHQFRDAVLECKMVLHRQPENVKALYRLGQAYLGTHELNNAMEVLMQAAKLEPNNAAVRNELARASALMSARKQREKQAFQHFFSSGQVGYPDVVLPADECDDDIWEEGQDGCKEDVDWQEGREGQEAAAGKQVGQERGDGQACANGAHSNGNHAAATRVGHGGSDAGPSEVAASGAGTSYGSDDAASTLSERGKSIALPNQQPRDGRLSGDQLKGLLAIAANPTAAGIPRNTELESMAAEMRERLAGWVDFGRVHRH